MDMSPAPFVTASNHTIDLDSADFDPIQAVDALLCEDPQTDEVLDLISVVESQIEGIDEEVLRLLRDQSVRASRAHQELAQAKTDITGLHGTMARTLELAQMTQEKVDAICKDIRAMDHAKRNLTQSISVLENFGTLTEALADLKSSSNDSSKYAENAGKLDSVLCLMEKFDAYENIPKVEALKDNVAIITRGLHQQLLREFQLAWVVTDPSALRLRTSGQELEYEERQRLRDEQEQRAEEARPKFQAIHNAALMAQALERRTQCKTAIMDEVMGLWIHNLRAACLDLGCDSRDAPLVDQFKFVFSWLTNVLESNRYFVEQWKAVPAEWKAPHQLAMRFCQECEPHLSQVLDDWAAGHGRTNSLEQRSSQLLQAWMATRAFERQLMLLLEGIHTTAGDTGYDKVKGRARAHLARTAPVSEPTSSMFDGRLRKLFTEHLPIVVEWHTSELRQAMQLLLQADATAAWLPADSSTSRLASARSLMLECRKHADNALTVIGRSRRCIILFMESLGGVLKEYASKLGAQLPGLRREPRRDLDTTDLPITAAPVVCCLASTATFFTENVPNLEAFILERCQEAAEGSGSGGGSEATSPSASLSLAPAAGAFEGLAAAGLKALVVGLVTALARYVDGPTLTGPGITVMAANVAAWKIAMTGDTSGYATSIAGVLSAWSSVLFKGLVPRDREDAAEVDMAFEHVCNKMVMTFVPHLFHHGIMKLRKLTDGALTQLSIDLAAIKEALVQFAVEAYSSVPSEQGGGLSGALASKVQQHKELVEQKLQPVIALLKVLQITDGRAFVSTYQQLLELRYQTPEHMQQFLGLLDIPKEVILSRIELFRTQMGSGRLPQTGGQRPITLSQAAPPIAGNVRGSASGMGSMSTRGAHVFQEVSSTLLSPGSRGALLAGTESFMGKGTALLSNVREKLGGAGRASSNAST